MRMKNCQSHYADDKFFSLSTIYNKQISNAENRHCQISQIKWNKWWNKRNYRKVDRKISLL